MGDIWEGVGAVVTVLHMNRNAPQNSFCSGTNILGGFQLPGIGARFGLNSGRRP